MPSSRQSNYWQLGISVALGMSGAIGQSGDRANSQSNIVPDSTLGNESSVVVPNFNGLPVEEIRGGQQGVKICSTLFNSSTLAQAEELISSVPVPTFKTSWHG